MRRAAAGPAWRRRSTANCSAEPCLQGLLDLSEGQGIGVLQVHQAAEHVGLERAGGRVASRSPER